MSPRMTSEFKEPLAAAMIATKMSVVSTVSTVNIVSIVSIVSTTTTTARTVDHRDDRSESLGRRYEAVVQLAMDGATSKSVISLPL